MSDGGEAVLVNGEQSESIPPPAEEPNTLGTMPPLTLVAAVAAVAATAIKRLAIPALSGVASDELIFTLVAHGRFFANLSGIAGLFAVSVALFAFVRDAAHAGLARRLLVATFAGVFLPTATLAVFFPKEQTSGEMVLFGVGAANVLAVALTMNAARNARLLSARAAGILCAGAAVLAFPAQVIPVMVRQQLEAWELEALDTVRNLGELSYLLALLTLTVRVFPVERGRRDTLARLICFAAMLLAIWTLFQALAVSPGFFSELLRLAQGIDLFSEKLPVVYTLPLALGFASALGSLVGSDGNRRQAGAGLLIWMAAGYAPCSPERLITFTLAMTLIARAVTASGVRVESDERDDVADE
jgi:hypothetical protein